MEQSQVSCNEQLVPDNPKVGWPKGWGFSNSTSVLQNTVGCCCVCSHQALLFLVALAYKIEVEHGEINV